MAFSFFKKSDKTPPKEKEENHSGPRYYDLTVKNVIQETNDAISVAFVQPEPKISYKAGQFLTLIVPMQGKDVRRAYSLCSSPFTDPDLVVTVKRVEKGLMSNWLPDNLKPGAKVRIMEPMGQFTTEFVKTNKRHIIMFAGGSGITPMMSLIKSILTQEPDSICSLIYCNRDVDSIIFKNTLDRMQTEDEGRLHVIHILDNAPMNWQGYSGLLNHDMLTKLFERIPDWGIDKTTYLMCGPEGMMKNVDTLLEARHIPKEKIFKESFVQGTIDKKETPAATEGGAAKDHEVTIRYDGQEYKVLVPAGKAILETALDQGIDLPYSCQSGLCTACRGKCLSGKVKLDEEEGLSKSERDEGYVLTCVGHPLTDDVVIEIG
ncbi:ring-1,2-phenylacetyl-CoA epoxidase subunit PaaE [Chryseolinea serpens]|uniref:Ring-1,2-phenylacetyl-CoA epoxidase subunit PaaE n=1 Tax=Chryseolinea serpens TaxID=947013 RepID=A0A1M5LX62_9BACT|nr:ferredoxin--NADP reductase [Chryseolinea serpens]SHG69576.1 ring-1,2-phenylacetyl-CoA epoxidase subunit PaaE [Chryseolinea serpens]